MAGRRRAISSGKPPRSRLSGHEARQIIRIITMAMGVADVLLGGGYVAGLPASTPSLIAMASVAPLPIWFGVLVIGGALLFVPKPWAADSVGFFLGGLVFAIWGVFTVLVLTWSWPLLALVSFLHLMGAWITGRLSQRTPRG